MKNINRAIFSAMTLGLLTNSAVADICDYRPSILVGQGTSSVVAAAGGVAAGTGAAMKAAGFYTLVHAGSGLTMLGSTMAGASAAGTVGIIAGTAGVIGTISAVLLAPVTIVAGGVTAVGVGGLEAACYFTDDRITDYDQVLTFMQHLAQHHPEEQFYLKTGTFVHQGDTISIWNPESEKDEWYMVSNLYIVNGTLMHRQRGRDKSLGYIAYVPEQEEE